jgi:acyl dehydratase
MPDQPYFEDISEGQEVTTLTQHCDSQRLVYWAAGSGDFYQIHYDKDFAQGTGLPDRIVHGALKHALLGRMLDEWVAETTEDHSRHSHRRPALTGLRPRLRRREVHLHPFRSTSAAPLSSRSVLAAGFQPRSARGATKRRRYLWDC